MKKTVTATEKILIEPGFHRVYAPPPKTGELRSIEPQESRLKKLRKRQRVKPQAVRVAHQVTPPDPGMSEVELLRTLQAHGIGRPATYAGIVDLLLKRAYVTREPDGELHITKRGQQVSDFLTGTYPHIFKPTYTAWMERALDGIAAGKRSYRAVLNELWTELSAAKRP